MLVADFRVTRPRICSSGRRGRFRRDGRLAGETFDHAVECHVVVMAEPGETEVRAGFLAGGLTLRKWIQPRLRTGKSDQ